MNELILLTGAAGAVGLETLKALVQHQDHYAVRVLEIRNARTEKALRPFQQRAEICWGDLTDRAAVETCAADVTLAIHLAAIIPPLADRQPALAERVNVQGTQYLIEALQRQSPHAFLLYTSSVSVYGDRVLNPWIKVTDPLRPSAGDHYAVTKIKAEQLVTQSNLKWSIFRLTGILSAQQKIDPLFFHMPLETSFEIATARDTGYALAQAVKHRAELQGRIFNLGGGEKCRTVYRDLLQGCFERSGLGEMDFPPEAFAQRNFHCGYFLDSNELEAILHFQRDSLADYFEQYAQQVPPAQKWLTTLLRRSIKQQMLRHSDPLQALQTHDEDLLRRFFRDGLVADSDARRN